MYSYCFVQGEHAELQSTHMLCQPTDVNWHTSTYYLSQNTSAEPNSPDHYKGVPLTKENLCHAHVGALSIFSSYDVYT